MEAMNWIQKPLPRDGLEYFTGAIRNSGRDPADFKVKLEELLSGGGVAHIQRRVTVITRYADKLYAAGSGTAWNADFERDLRANSFG